MGAPTVRLTVDLYNPSQLAVLPLGTLSTRFSYAGEVISEISIPEVSVWTGSNRIQVIGSLVPRGDAAVAALGKALGGYLMGQGIVLDA